MLEPPISTPTVSTAAFGAPAISPVPAAAVSPAAIATRRGPQRAVPTVANTMARQ